MNRRSTVLWAGVLLGRTEVADRVDLRFLFRTMELRAGSLAVAGFPTRAGQSSLRHQIIEPRPFGSRFFVIAHQPRSRDFSQIPFGSPRLESADSTWARHRRIPGSALGGASCSNRSSPGSRPSGFHRFCLYKNFGRGFRPLRIPQSNVQLERITRICHFRFLDDHSIYSRMLLSGSTTYIHFSSPGISRGPLTTVIPSLAIHWSTCDISSTSRARWGQ